MQRLFSLLRFQTKKVSPDVVLRHEISSEFLPAQVSKLSGEENCGRIRPTESVFYKEYFKVLQFHLEVFISLC